MRIYLLSLGTGILMGEQILPVAKHMLDGSPLAAAWEVDRK